MTSQAERGPKEPSRDLILQWGGAKLEVPGEGSSVFFSTFVTGQYIPLRMRESDVVLDAGANVGDFTVWAARKLSRTGLVIAVEPNPVFFEILKRNLSLNRLDNVTPINAAIGDTHGVANLVDDGVGTRISDGTGAGTFSVPQLTIDEILEAVNRPKIDVIKMDIEGSEEGALLAFSQLGSVRELMVELHSPRIASAIREHLTKLEFEVAPESMPDVASHMLREVVTHPFDLIRAEAVSRGFMLRSLVSFARIGRNAVPFLDSTSQVSMVHARAHSPS